MRTFKKLFFLLSSQQRKYLGLLLVIITIMAFLDMVGVVSILPFMAVLTNQGLVETNVILKTMFKASGIFGVETKQEFIFALGILVFLLLVCSLLFKALTIYLQAKFVLMIEYSIGKSLLEGYLHQPYSWFLSRHSSDVGKTILSEVAQVTGNGISPLIELISKFIITITLIALLLIVNLKLTLVIGLSLGTTYLIIFYFVKKYLSRLGAESLKNNQLRFRSVNEAFGAIKLLKLKGLEKIYIKFFSNSAKIFARNQASLHAIGQLPRFILETIAFGGVLLIILYTMGKTGNFNTSLPILSLYVFAGYRLMPALQQIYVSCTQLTFVGPSLHKLYIDLKNLKPTYKYQDNSTMIFNKAITLKNIHYNYPKSSRAVLKGINLTIPSKSSVGLVGVTGSGKTTLVDIILRLLEPQKGTLEIDGKVISEQNSRGWQNCIGYVPQNIHLSDDTVQANIAFGVDLKDVKKDIIEKVSKIADVHNFVLKELAQQYQTTIGENGVRLSGGQRQRIGIARALYHNPKVLILDEATSALDNETEKAVMESINNFCQDITIIIIAHRLNTVKNCDFIFKLDKGQLVRRDKFLWFS